MRLFNSGYTNQFNPHGRILEIGPGPAPINADVYLDISQEYLALLRGKKVVHGKATELPFAAKEFDYCVAMHIAEHLPAAEVPVFFSEIARVAKGGYIEVPAIFLELLVNADVDFSDFGREQAPYDPHQSYWFYDGATAHVIMKSNTGTREKHILRTMFHLIFNKAISAKYVDLFMMGFEWKDTPRYRMHKSLEDVPEDLFAKILQHIHDYAETIKRRQAGRGTQLAHRLVDVAGNSIARLLARR